MTTATYDNLGVRFLFPENWQVLDEEKEGWPKSVTLQSPGSGMWAVHIYPEPSEEEAVARDVVTALQEEYDDVEVSPAAERLGEFDAFGFDMHFYCFDFLVRASVRVFTIGERTYTIFFQVEDREFNALEPVFSALVHSMLHGLQS